MTQYGTEHPTGLSILMTPSPSKSSISTLTEYRTSSASLTARTEELPWCMPAWLDLKLRYFQGRSCQHLVLVLWLLEEDDEEFSGAAPSWWTRGRRTRLDP